MFGGKGRLWSDKRRANYIFSTDLNDINKSKFVLHKKSLIEPACFTGMVAPLQNDGDKKFLAV